MVDDRKKMHPTFRPLDFKAYMKSPELQDEYDAIVNSFLDDFGYPTNIFKTL
jgi:hypothetical protein